ncbi:helix-turn-helix domain-containing protein [Ancylobacter oerskovii]|uniref:Helix-turn-helix domain-containing protein n=1 Tax=Ancylobacter oerskovii TaxID=459519 RepID=A0ABW4Z1W2_9HYPH|nr:helix-turn-helix transcriptional regulator [Ancylobacter oerskovii]MBS7545064.1 helix-turn-helix transcriptional regulator [Ancylobacter oerskovii]
MSGVLTAAGRLKRARINAGYRTAAKAIRAFGWVGSTYYGHENGDRGMDVADAKKYAEAYGVHWVTLLEGEAPTVAHPKQLIRIIARLTEWIDAEVGAELPLEYEDDIALCRALAGEVRG